MRISNPFSKLLSELIIDSNKDWNNKVISNVQLDAKLANHLDCNSKVLDNIRYQAGTDLHTSANTERYTNSTTLTKVKEVKVLKPCNLNIRFDIKLSGACIAYAYGAICLNDEIKHSYSTNSTTYEIKTYDLYECNPQDLVQLWYKVFNVLDYVYVRNFRLRINKFQLTTNVLLD